MLMGLSLTFLFLSLFLMVLINIFMYNKSIMLEKNIMPLSNSLLEFNFSFIIDYVSLFYSFTICSISLVIIIYSKFYMDLNIKNNMMSLKMFLTFLTLFIISMTILVFSNSWITVMMGWDGLGVSSFMLVIFYNNMSSLNSGMITFITNRLGDALFMISFMMMASMSWLSYEFFLLNMNKIFMFMMLTGMMTKSAQFPFYSWLPAAMAAPTPVSSLVHSSTLVTAGVFLLIRYNFLMNNYPIMIMMTTAITMMVSGMSAMMEMDFKKMIAMSTLSQLGFMMITISLGMWKLTLLHMICHAYFKSSLFLTTGMMMHNMFSKQESRNFSPMYYNNFSKLILMMSSMSLVGFPFSLGFISKDTIIAFMMKNLTNFYFLLIMISCLFTVTYTIRIMDNSMIKNSTISSEIFMKESNFSIFPMSLSFLISIILTKYLFWFMPYFSIISLFESFLGIVIIMLGMMMYTHNKNNIMMKNVFNSLFLINLITTKMTMMNKKMSTLYEETWMEKMTNKSLITLLSKLYLFMKNMLKKPIFLMIIMFMLMNMMIM